MKFFKSSHEGGQVPHVEETSTTDNLLSRGQFIENPPHEKPLPIQLRGGQATLHHFHMIHQSGHNLSDSNRIGLAVRYMAASVKQTGKIRESVTLISGQHEHDGFDLEPILPSFPSKEDVRRGKEAHADAMRREAANYFEGTSTASAYDELLA